MLTFINKNFKIITKSNYKSSVYKIELNTIKCTQCSNVHCFHHHGKYPRKVKIGPVKLELEIYRIICSCCGITHAILPYSIIPYTQRTLEDTIIIYDLISSGAPFNYGLIYDYPSIDLSDLYALKRNFHLWKDVLASISLDDDPCNLSESSFRLKNCNLSQMRFQFTDFFVIV